MTNSPAISSPVLIIEDEAVIAIEIESALSAAGYTTVGLACTEKQALTKIAGEPWEAAVVDANLHGCGIQQIVVALHERNIPYLLVTGYGRENLPPSVSDAPLIEKPFDPIRLTRAVTGLLDRMGT